MIANDNGLTIFVTRPASAVILSIAALTIVWPFARKRSKHRTT